MSRLFDLVTLVPREPTRKMIFAAIDQLRLPDEVKEKFFTYFKELRGTNREPGLLNGIRKANRTGELADLNERFQELFNAVHARHTTKLKFNSQEWHALLKAEDVAMDRCLAETRLVSRALQGEWGQPGH